MGINLTNLYISESFNNLLQKSGSKVTTGVGVDVSSLDLSVTSASFASTAATATSATSATSASYASTASHAIYAETAGEANSVSFANITGKPTLVSGSSQIDVSSTTGNLPAARISGSVPTATSASYATTALSASHALVADSVTGTVTNATYAQNTIVTGKNVTGTLIAKGTPLYFTGSGTSGNLVGVIPADASNPSLMPAGGIAGEAIASGAEGVVLLDGFINGVDTSAFSAGDEVYVAVGGGYTNVVPTGSANLIQKLGNVEKVDAIAGSGVINGPGAVRSVPNIAQDHVWKGDANGVPQAVNQNTLSVKQAVSSSRAYVNVSAANVDYHVTFNTITAGYKELLQETEGAQFTYNPSNNKLTVANISATTLSGSLFGNATSANTASFVTEAVVAKTNKNNNFTGTQTFNNIAVNGTGSFAYIQQVTGSAKIIGDAFIILNNDTPTERYAGIKVQDSGSGSPLTTASLEFDGQTNDWFYEYSNDGGATAEHGVVIFGPEYSTKGSPTYLTANKLPKASGSHHIIDSNISDDGTDVTIASNLGVQGNIVLDGSSDSIFVNGIGGQIRANNLSGSWGQTNGTYTLDIIGNVGASTGFVGDLTGNADTATSASYASNAGAVSDPNIAYRNQNNTFSQTNTFTGPIVVDGTSATLEADASLILKEGPGGAGASSIIFYSGSNPGASYLSLQPQPSGNGNVVMTDSTDNSKFVIFNPTAGKTSFPKPIAGGANADSALSISAGANITGSTKLSGSATPLNIQMPNLGTNQESEIITFNGLVDAKGTTYNVARNLYQNYPAFGTPYDHSFGTEIYDSFGYNFGTELLVGPRAVNGSVVLSGSQAGNTARLRIREFGTTGQTEGMLYAHTASLASSGKTDIFSSGNNYNAIFINYSNPDGSLAESSSIAKVAIGQSFVTASETQVAIDGNHILIGYVEDQSGGGAAEIGIGRKTHTQNLSLQSAQNINLEGQNIYVTGSGIYVTGSVNITGSLVNIDTDVKARRLQFEKNPFNGALSSNLAALRLNEDNTKFLITNYDLANAQSQSMVQLTSDTGSNYNEAMLQANYGGTTGEIKITNNSGNRVAEVVSDRFKVSSSNIELTGSLSATGSINFKVPQVATGNETQYISFPSYTTTATTNPVNYAVNYVGTQNYPAFGNQFENIFTVDFLDPGQSYNYYSEAVFGGQRMGMMLKPSGSGNLANLAITSNAEQTRTFGLLYADELQIGVFKGDYIQIGQIANNPTVKIDAGQTQISGSVRGKVNSISIASQTGSLNALAGNYFEMTLVSGSNTHVTVSNVLPGQTYILKTLQPSTSADSVGTITFNSEFKFSGGTAPTASATTGSVDVYTFVSFDSSNVLSTQVTDLK